jgi:menaquinone-dependent protoporphyrinogen IX oxidase
MRTIVVYASVSGFTKRYAEWIAEDLSADIIPVAELKKTELSGYDVLIYGGCLHAVGISGLKKIKRCLDGDFGGRLIVFATGASPFSERAVEEVKGKNFTDAQWSRIKFFYFRGGFDFSKLDGPNRLIMTFFKWALQKKKDKTEDVAQMLEAYDHPMDYTDRGSIGELVRYARSYGPSEHGGHV